MYYQVGGSLTNDAPSYVARQSDTDLYEALKRGDFCYVLNSRQMGKSSLLVHTRHRLQREGYSCTVLDMTSIGSENITPLQWYKGIVKELWRGFRSLRKFDFKNWWQDEEDISLLQRLSRFIGDVLLKELPNEKIVIFIDEIDSILSLPFSVDDFFALIRFCHNQRAIEPDYQRLNFAIFGVATPADLIRDRQRTPFNLGTAIALNGFSLAEAKPLTQGLAVREGNAETVLQEILNWTNGQPFLTQKLCQLAIDASQDAVNGILTIPPGNEAYWVQNLVKTKILQNWETQDEPEHLKTIRNRLLSNPEVAGRLLGIYQQVWQESEVVEAHSYAPVQELEIKDYALVPADDSREQVELLLSGLVVKANGYLQVKNRVYAEIFDRQWVEQQLSLMRPYSQALEAWAISKRQDESRLLRGQALLDAQKWSQGKRLGDLDYQFLAASVESDRQQVQQALEADRVKAVEAQLFQEKRNVRLQRWFLITHSIGILISLGLSICIFWLYRQSQANERQAKISEIEALVSSSQGKLESHHHLEAAIDAIKAKSKLQQLQPVDPQVNQNVAEVLQRVIYGIEESNRLDVGTAVKDLDISPDGRYISSASVDGRVKLWGIDGTLKREFSDPIDFPCQSPVTDLCKSLAHQANANAVSFSPDGQSLISAAADRTLKLWSVDGTLLKTFVGHQAEVIEAQFSPDGQLIASTAEDQSVKIWHKDGTLRKNLPQRGIKFAFSPDGKILATAAIREPIHLWRADGTLIKVLPQLKGSAHKLAFSPDGQKIAYAGMHSATVLGLDGRELQTFALPHAGIWGVRFSPDGRSIAVGGQDTQLRLLLTNSNSSSELPADHRDGLSDDGLLSASLLGHKGSISGVKFTPKGDLLASAAEDGTIRLWKLQKLLTASLSAEIGGVLQVAVSPAGNQIISVGRRGTINIWQTNVAGQFNTLPTRTFLGHQQPILDVAFSADGRFFATGSRDGTAILWQADGKRLQILPFAQSALPKTRFKSWALVQEQRSQRAKPRNKRVLPHIEKIAFSADNRYLATVSSDYEIALWERSPNGLIREPQKPRLLPGNSALIKALAFSPDSQSIVSGSEDRTLKIRGLDGKSIVKIAAHQAPITSIAFHPQAKIFASGAQDGKVKLWRTDGSLIRTLAAGGAVLRVNFSPDGKYIVAGNSDGAILLWKSDGSFVKTLKRHDGAIRGVAFTPNSKMLVSAGDDQKIWLWDLDRILSLNELAYACKWVKDYWRSHPNLKPQWKTVCQG